MRRAACGMATDERVIELITAVSQRAKMRALAAHRRRGRVAVQVIGADVEHRGGAAGERVGGLELEARQLEHVELGRQLIEQLERRLAEIAADARTRRRRARPCAASSVVTVLLPLVPVMPTTGARDGAREQLDVADDLDAAGGAPRRRSGSASETPGRPPRSRRRRAGRIEAAELHRDGRIEGARARASPGGAARVSVDRHAPAARAR